MSSVRPSVRLSVTLVNCDHIGWNSSKIISPLVSLGRSLFATLCNSNMTGLLQGELVTILTHRRHLGKISNGNISATGGPIHFMFGYGGRGAGSFGDGGSNDATFDSNKSKMAAAAILDNFEWPYLRNGSRSTYIARIARSSLR